MKTIIVGGGIMGLATAWALAREGHAVELFEQGALPNPLASSVDEHRLIRHPYGDRTGYARMINPAFAAWDLCRAILVKAFMRRPARSPSPATAPIGPNARRAPWPRSAGR